MPFRVLLAASPSFCNGELFEQKLNYLLQFKPDREFHVLTQRVFTKMCTDYSFCIVHRRDFFNDGPQTTIILYNTVCELVDAAIIFWDGETTNEKRLIDRCQKDNIKHVVIMFESLKQQLKREKIEKPKRKKITVQLSKEAKERYFKAHMIWFMKQYPTAWRDGHYAKPKILPINSGSRMDTFIINFLIWSGWNATKINVMGRKINGVWVASTTKKGTQDITCTINGRSVKIETKHGSDTPSPDQLKMQQRERNAGGISEIVYSIDEFFLLYDKILEL